MADTVAVRSALSALHRRDPIDIVEGPELSMPLVPPTLPAVRILRMHGGHHFLSTSRGLRPRRARGWLERRSFQRAEHLCAVGQHVADETRRLLDLGDRPITVLPNFVDLRDWSPISGAREPGCVLYVGTMSDGKGVRDLVDAIPAIRSAVPAARLRLVGRDTVDTLTGGSYVQRLLARLSSELRSAVEWVGVRPRDELAAEFARSEVCVFPSHAEAMPLAWLEAMAMECACVVSDIGTARDLIDDGVTGLRCPPRDPGSLAAAVIRMLRDRGLRSACGAAARRRVMSAYCAEVMVPANERFYQGILSLR